MLRCFLDNTFVSKPAKTIVYESFLYNICERDLLRSADHKNKLRFDYKLLSVLNITFKYNYNWLENINITRSPKYDSKLTLTVIVKYKHILSKFSFWFIFGIR